MHVRFYQKYGLPSGLVEGLFHPRILLPEEIGTNEFQFTVIHEMVHYLHRDVFFKWSAWAVQTVYWFCPLTGNLLRQASKWCEYACDYEVYRRTRSVRAYGEMLLQIALRERSDKSGLVTLVGSNASELRKRLVKMKSFGHQTGKRTILFIITAVLMLTVLGGGIAFAATAASIYGYEALYQATVVETVECAGSVITQNVDTGVYPDNRNIDPEDYANTGVEFIDMLPIDGYTIQENESEEISDIGLSGELDHRTLECDDMIRSSLFHANEGDCISVQGVVSPGHDTIRVGICRPDRERYCIYVKDHFTYNYAVTRSGCYYVYIVNDNCDTVELRGFYLKY